MRSVSVRLADLDRVKINLGFAGENEHTHVLFDCKKAFDQYPNATPFLIVTPPRGDIYPAVVTRDGDIVEWVVTDSDLIYHGNGKVQLQFQQNNIVMKSYEAMTSIAKSSEPTGTVPTPIQNWITQANAILAAIPDDINAALAAAKASGEFDGADGVGIAAITLKSTVGLIDTYTITLTDGRDYDFTVTNGTPGQNGVGIQSIAKTSTVGLVDTYTVTLTNGQTYPFTVTNGQNGVEIDDITPANNKVFSSAKVAEMNTQFLNAIQQKYTKPNDGIPASDLASGVIPSVPVQDVQVNGTSILSQGVANVPIAGNHQLGLVWVGGDGLSIKTSGVNNGQIYAVPASDNQIKTASASYNQIPPAKQHQAVFYGLAKAAGNSDQSSSSNAVGVYTEDAKRKITDMIEPQFRVIADVTMTEDATDLVVDTDTNGNPFNLREIMIELSLTATNGAGNGAVKINEISGNCYLTIPNAFSSSATTTRYGTVTVKGGRLFGDATAQDQNTYDQHAALYTNKSMRGIFECNGITKIKLWCLNAYKIATGSKIKIIGR